MRVDSSTRRRLARSPTPGLRPAFGLGLAILISISGCDTSSHPKAGVACDSKDDCRLDQRCVDGVCVVAGGEDGGAPAPQDASSCPSATICGTPPVCCEPGQECVEDRCLPGCESGVRCGDGAMTCCGSGQVCISDSCVDPGEECSDSFDCPIGDFCEPTLGRCLPQLEPVACRIDPVYGSFEAEIEWSATAAEEAPGCMHSIAAPIVVDLTGDGLPEVVVSFACEDDWQHGVLRAYGGDGTPLWSATGSADRVNARTSIAGADLDGDGRAEIVAVESSRAGGSRLMAFDDDGRVVWRSVDEDGSTPYFVSGFGNGAPAIANLDDDPAPEIILGATVFDASGRLLWVRDRGPREGTNSGYAGGIAAVADLDIDGAPEIVTGNRAYESNGDPLWVAETNDGYPAVAQFDSDPQPEVVLVASGQVFLLDGRTGAVEWGPSDLPGGGRGGPPTVADFDGDGLPEIGVAGAGSYSVYDPSLDDDVLWSMTTVDQSSNATGSSVFDFEGDGAAEVVYGDECHMRVYRGRDGVVLLEIPSSSATIHEYPLVADVDGDGNSEIVIVANDNSSGIRTRCLDADREWDGARNGVFVYGDTRDQWMRTRRIWNQHAYHVTNVGADGIVPAVEPDSWSVEGLNSYRQNVQGEGVHNAPDLSILALEAQLDRCPTYVTLRARVTNGGSLGVRADVPVTFFSGTPDSLGAMLGTVSTTVSLLPGATTVVELVDVPLAGEGPYDFVAFVDYEGDVDECRDDNNEAAIAEISCDILY